MKISSICYCNLSIIKNAIDFEKYSFNQDARDVIRDSLGIGESVVIGHVGSFTPPKNHKFLIDIFEEINQKKENCVLLLVGEGHLKDSIIKKVSDLGLNDKVIFTGLRADVHNLLKAMDIFVFPSFFEGVPVTLIEAQAAGLQCLISDKISDEVKISSNIITLSIMDSSSNWASKIIEMLNSKKNQEVKDEINNSGYDIIQSSKRYSDIIIQIMGAY